MIKPYKNLSIYKGSFQVFRTLFGQTRSFLEEEDYSPDSLIQVSWIKQAWKGLSRALTLSYLSIKSKDLARMFILLSKRPKVLFSSLGSLFLILNGAMSLHSQSLEDYFQVAAENNLGLQAKYKSFEAALQKVNQVSLQDPQLSLAYFISPIETRLGPQGVRFSLSQIFPWFGTLEAQKKVETLKAELKYQEFLEDRNQLFYQVSAAYFPLFELEKLLAIEAENQRVLSSYKEIATIKFRNTQGAMVDVLRVDIMLKDAQSNLSILKQKKKPLTIALNRLLNRPDSLEILLPDSLFIQGLALNYRRDSLLNSNPLLDKLDLKIKVNEANEQAIIKQGLPKFGIGLNYVIIGQRRGVDIPDNGRDAFMPMLSMSLPIFRGKYKSAQKESQLLQESFSLQKEELKNQLNRSYEMTYFEIQKQVEENRLYEEQIQISEDILKLLYTAYANSGKDFEEVLSTQQEILKYKKMKVKSLIKYHIALAELDYITGK